MHNAIDINYRVLLPGESPREYRKHVVALFTAVPPADYYEQLLIEEFAAASWAWRRARAIEADYLHLAGSSYNRSTPGIAEALFYLPDTRFRAHRQFMHDAERRHGQAGRSVEEIRRLSNRGTAAPAAATDGAEPVLSAPAPIRVRPAARRAAVAKIRNEPNAPATAVAPISSDPPLATPPPAQNEPKPASGTLQRPRVWQEVVMRVEPKPRPSADREGDRAMRRFLEIAENQLRNDESAES